MSIHSKISGGAKVAVFTRNHLNHLEDALKLSKDDPERQIVFRASVKWVSARDALRERTPIDLYAVPIDGSGRVEFAAELCEVDLDPERGKPRTDRLLKLVLPSTIKEGLWEEGSDKKPTVGTLYAIRNCRLLPKPFPMTDLVKVSDDRRLSHDYGYSYSLVYDYG